MRPLGAPALACVLAGSCALGALVATLARIEPHASPNLESDVKALTNSAGVAVPWNTRARYFCKSGSCFN